MQESAQNKSIILPGIFHRNKHAEIEYHRVVFGPL